MKKILFIMLALSTSVFAETQSQMQQRDMEFPTKGYCAGLTKTNLVSPLVLKERVITEYLNITLSFPEDTERFYISQLDVYSDDFGKLANILGNRVKGVLSVAQSLKCTVYFNPEKDLIDFSVVKNGCNFSKLISTVEDIYGFKPVIVKGVKNQCLSSPSGHVVISAFDELI